MRALVVVMFFLLLAAPIEAAERLAVHGFAMATYQPGQEPADHIRVILTQNVQSDVLAKVVLTPIGPISQLSYVELIWLNPFPGIKSITAGRTFPVFGRIWYDRRVDMVPTIFYSDINSPLAAIDTGATIVGEIKQLQWTVGAYSGDAIFGNNRSPNLSLRGEYNVSQNLIVAASQRVSAVPAIGVDVVMKLGALVLTGESVASEGETQYALLGEVSVTDRTSFAIQHERLSRENRWTGALTQSFGHLEAKLGYQWGRTDRVIGQAVVRW